MKEVSREVFAEVYIDEFEWYTVAVERDLSFEDTNVYELHVWYEDDNTPDSRRLVAGTSLLDLGDGLPSRIETRKAANGAFNIVVAELLALIHLGRAPKHPLLTMMNDSAKIEEAREVLEDMWYIVIE